MLSLVPAFRLSMWLDPILVYLSLMSIDLDRHVYMGDGRGGEGSWDALALGPEYDVLAEKDRRPTPIKLTLDQIDALASIARTRSLTSTLDLAPPQLVDCHGMIPASD